MAWQRCLYERGEAREMLKKKTTKKPRKTGKERNQKRDKGKEGFYSCFSLGDTQEVG